MAPDPGGTGALTIRSSTANDRKDIIALLASSLGWEAGDDYERLFAWKHEESPFGASPAWVAVDEGKIVGFRTMMRWEFMLDGVCQHAVRAVDTATDPAYQGRGIFSRLTRHALTELENERVDFVFNTPNAQSQRGYQKMGWQVVGRLPLTVRPRGLPSAARMLRTRRPADLWSVETAVGVLPGEALDDSKGVERLLEAQPTSDGLLTRRSPAFLRWRYDGLTRLAYRVLMPTTRIEDGFVVFRLRRRGRAVEAVVADELAAAGDRGALDQLLRSLPSRTGSDYVLRAGTPAHHVRGFLPLPRQGPTVACRPLGRFSAPSLPDWKLTIGDVELF